ncbi:iron-containing alcohol dehydrogenase [Halomonas eurihalina]|uniref:Iron-containing alcohol dehydrogenase n=1 Tax=Halomonas eurihalina TaxID=42566 RepID=A0A5D9D9Z4_HALER|nr:iron-containing alcohol dehydrogenase [Halomonas eurihalina]MDR5859908.1 iron-containing alcohol dehydrogenase [Halomonas eurihalina]TZG39910.1 iron-containing alcohol dehydrogenase [Halomonas eurihalina]
MPMNFTTGRQVPLVVGAGALAQLPELCHAHGASSTLIVADAGIAATGLVDRLASLLNDELPVTRFIAPAGEPTLATVDAGAEAARELTSPLVIGLGGGTALDIAKLVAALAESPGTMADYLLARTPWTGRAPSVMIPTTSGTGSEVTRTSIVTDAQGSKQWAWGDELLPEAVLLDPELTRTLPAPLTAATGLDAFVHALEAASGKSRHAFIEASARQAMRLIGQALPRAVTAPDDLEARQQMQVAACLAGQAIDNGGTGLGHNIGHALGSLYHLPHGIAVTLGVEATLAWTIEGREAVFAPTAEALASGNTASELPARFSTLVDAAHFNAALAPFANLELNAGALAATMQAEENAPMADNAARRPEADDWHALAEATVSLFERRLAHLKAAQEHPA